MSVDNKYKTQALKVLSTIEAEQERLWDKKPVNFVLYERDILYCKKEGINVSRILRLKFHEWLLEKDAIFDEHGVKLYWKPRKNILLSSN